MLMVLNRELIVQNGTHRPWLRTAFAAGPLLVGFAAVAGWAMGIPALTSVRPALVPMVVNTALSFIAIGSGLLLLPAGVESGRLTRRKSVAAICATLAMMFGILTLAEYATGIPFGIDELFFTDPTISHHPGRPSLAIAVSVFCAGVALLLLVRAAAKPGGFGERSVLAAHLLALIPASVSYVTLAGYLFDVKGLYSFGPFNTVSITAGIASGLTALAILHTASAAGWRRFFAEAPAAARAFEHRLVFALSLPLLIGGITVWGASMGAYDPVFSSVLLAFAAAASSSALTWLLSASKTKFAEEALRQSEERYRGIFEHACTGIAIADLEGRFHTNNPAFCDMLGYTREELRRLRVGDLTHPEDQEANMLLRLRLLAQEIPSFEILNRSIAKCGTPRWLHKHVTLIRDAAGKPVGTLGLVTDMTERKRVEEALRESEERFRGIFENAGTGIAIADLEGRFQSCNPAYAAMLGYSEQELLGLICGDLMHPEDREASFAEKRRLLAGDIPSFQIVSRYIGKGGKLIWVHKHVTLLSDAAGRPTNTVVLATDITERKRQDDQIRILMREVNHRSKNLLTVVQAIARQTAAATPIDFADRFADRVQALAASQDLLVKNDWKGAKLDELVRSQLAHLEDLIGSRITLKGPSLLISASAAQAIGMALHELATNAGKYGALSKDSGRVAIEWSVDGKHAGAQTFAMCWREQDETRVAPPSTRGFGSTVICELAELSLAAKVDLEFPASGLSWRLHCPADQILQEANPAPTVQNETPARSPAVTANGRLRVLVLEDEAVVAMEIAQVLTKAGFEAVGPARAASQALRLINEVGCDVAVLDVNLGNETSETVALKLMERGTPFITLSGYSKEQHPLVFNGTRSLIKPMRSKLLIAELEACIAEVPKNRKKAPRSLFENCPQSVTISGNRSQVV